MQKEMQGKAARHLSHAISELNAKEENRSFGANGIRINEVEIQLQYNESDADFRNKFVALMNKQALHIDNEFKSFIASKGFKFSTKKRAIVIVRPTKFEDYQLNMNSIVNINVDFNLLLTKSNRPNEEMLSSIHTFFNNKLAGMFYMFFFSIQRGTYQNTRCLKMKHSLL